MIPSAFEVQVKTQEPVVVTIDVSEKTMVLGAFVMVIGAVTWMKIKKS
ncbi:hypothetical protein OPW33_24240 [Vibrio europaeus]|nr:hypothetical protein [Vibrio europaeus]MDC5840182.1 hypothetical protein [Vibrio europaeus]MDC5840201.1 hypothetical protein [Vibrio europaeus]MDC5842440.1 hypothetical protein [Vibrio europaeus]